MRIAPANKKKLIWQIPVLLILGLIVLERWSPGAVTNLPVLREAKVHWYSMRLYNDDPEIQVSAAYALGHMGPRAKGAVPALIAALDSSRSEVRDAAARALGNIGPAAESAVESLIRIQKTEREFLTVEEALGKIGGPGLEPFLKGLRDKNVSVRQHAAESLSKILLVVPDPKLAQKATQPLTNALHDEDAGVRNAAAMAMQSVVPAIKDPETRATVAKAFIRAVKDRRVAPYAAGVLVKIAEAGPEPLISALEDEYSPERDVDPAVEEPNSRGTTVDRLIRIMAEREEMRGVGAGTLRLIGEPAFEPLVAALGDEDDNVREAAALAMQFVLPAVKDPKIRAKATEPLIQAMMKETGSLSYTPLAFVKIGEPAVEPLLRVILDHDHGCNERMALSAGFALGEILRSEKDAELVRRTVEPLITALGDDRPQVCGQAATALGQMFSSDVGDAAIRQTVVVALLEALQDDNSWVRSSARKALDQIIPGGQTIEPALTLHAGGVGNVAFSPDGKWLAAGSGKGLDIRDDTTTVWDAVTGEETLTLGHAGGVAFSPDGRWLVTGNGTSTARLWDLKAENPDAGSRELKGDTYSSWSVAISPDGRWLVTGNSDNTARLWDLKSENPAAGCREIKSEVKGHTLSCINCVAISPDGRWLVTGNWTKKARLWDLKSKNPAAGSRALIGHIDAIICMAISPDGRWLVTGSMGKTARLWDLKSENPAAGPLELKDHTKAIYCVAISPDGRWLATGSDDGTVRLWDLKSENPAAESREIKGYAGHIRWVGFSPDGKWLAAPSGAKVRMWEVETGLEMQSFETGSFTVVQPRRVGPPGHASSPICSVAFSPDGKRLASVSWDKTVNVWDIRPMRARLTERSR